MCFRVILYHTSKVLKHNCFHIIGSTDQGPNYPFLESINSCYLFVNVQFMTLIIIACINKPIRIQEVVMRWLNCVFEMMNYKLILVDT